MLFTLSNIKKLRYRVSLVLSNSLNSISLPAVNVLFSLAVVKVHGVTVYGNFVYYFLWATLASFVMNWGNRDHLLREFSKNPAEIPAKWRESFITRSLLIFPLAVVFFLFFSLPETLLLLQWAFALFFAQSFDVLFVYHRRFIHSFIIELVSGIFLLAYVVFKTGFDLYTIYLLYLLIRTVLFLLLFGKDILKNFNVKFRLELLKGSVLFFLLSLTGLLGSRIDQYCVSILLSKENLGQYQVLKSFLLYFQAAAGFIILPFVKNIYRLKEDSVDKISYRLFLAGVVLTPVFIVILFIFMNYFYGFSFSFDIYIYSAIFILPIFYYTVVVYKLFNKNKLNVIIYITSVSFLISLILNIILIPILNIKGSLVASVIAGLIAVLLFYINNKRWT